VASDQAASADAVGSAIDSGSVLSEDSRRHMFTFIRSVGHTVTRDDAAASVGIFRKLAAFHLDKLVDVGLLRARYETPGGIRIRKVARRPKVCQRSQGRPDPRPGACCVRLSPNDTDRDEQTPQDH
jgi:hypothetical protein